MDLYQYFAKELDCFELIFDTEAISPGPPPLYGTVRWQRTTRRPGANFNVRFRRPAGFQHVDAAKLYLLKHRCLPDDL